MFGGDPNNCGFPVFLGDNGFQYDTNALPQLQLFGDYPVGNGISPLNYTRKDHAAYMDRSTKRFREAESFSKEQKHPITLSDKIYPDEAGHSGSIFNPNPVSTGLKLSYEEDEHNSSVTSASESMTAALPLILSLGDNFKGEFDRQKEEFDHYIRIQEENLTKGVRELRQRHTAAFLSAVEKGVGKKLHEKDLELENMNRKNKELEERVKQVTAEVQSWHYRAKYNESVVNVLKSNLQQVMAQGTMQGKEGCGDSEVDDAASYTNQNHLSFVDGFGTSGVTRNQMTCKSCKIKEVSILLLPCKHLCLCKDCAAFIDVCPLCNMIRTDLAQVYMC